MTVSTIMQGAPPSADAQVTLANWRTRPFSAWSFHHVREVLPTAAIRAGRSTPLRTDPADLAAIAFETRDGREMTVGALLAQRKMDGLVALRGGRLVGETYGGLYDGTRPHILFSVSKSITATLAGILADRDVLDPDALVTDILPEVEGSAYDGATVRHVLDMTVSTSFSEEYLNDDGDYIRYRRATAWDPVQPGQDPGDQRSFLATMPGGAAGHGDEYHYVSPNSDLLGWLIERAANRRLPDLMSDLLWQPLGAEADADITVDRMGAPRTAGGISATVRDLARFGEMMRLGGMASDQQVVPRWWVDDIFKGGNPDPWRKGDMKGLFPKGGYRSKWYQTGNGGICAIGIHGQWLLVDPEREIVVAMVSSEHEPTNDPADVVTIAMLEGIARGLAPKQV